ncbi:hypothetical protein [Inquilinus sp.]|jgi:hypothetical protein|uniref:hypothetical protein n=1 Tax=Inquilinus sp. TaxID=1932117 RepID=UPI003783E6EF
MQMLDARDPILRGPAGLDDLVLEAALQPVVRVSVVQGPYNALVLVRGTLAAGAVETDAIHAVRTNFAPAGFDPDAPFKHSSTAALHQAGGEIDVIDHGYFDETGRWVLLVRGDSLRGQGAIELTSWVMCREEVPASTPAGPDERLAFRSYPFFVPPKPPEPVDPWARAMTRLFPRRPDAAARSAA